MKSLLLMALTVFSLNSLAADCIYMGVTCRGAVNAGDCDNTKLEGWSWAAHAGPLFKLYKCDEGMDIQEAGWAVSSTASMAADATKACKRKVQANAIGSWPSCSSYGVSR